MGKPTKILTAEEFDRLFNDKERFIRIAYSYINDMEMATDITTDGFMYLWEHRDHLEFDVNIKGYIYNYVRTRCISYLRKRKSMLKAQSELYRKEQWRIESSINTLSNEEQIGKLFQSEIIEIYRRELAKMPSLTRNVFFGKPSGRYDLPSNCGKIQPDRPAGYFGDSAGKFLASDTAKRLSGECYNYAAISTINEKEWKPSACNECQEILRRSSQPMCILPCKYALPLVRIRVEPVRTYCRRQFPDMKTDAETYDG